MTAIIGGTKELVVAVLGAVKDLKPGDIEKADAAARVFDSIGGLVKNLKPPESMVSALATDEAGWDASYNVKFKNLMSDYAGFMDEILPVFKKHLPKILDKIFQIKIPKELAADPKRIEMISQAMDVVAKFSSVFQDMASVAIEVGGGKDQNLTFGPNFEHVMKNYATVMDGISGALTTHLPKIINTVLDIARGVKDPKGVGKKLDIVVKAMDSAGKFAGMIKNIMDLVPMDKVDAGEKASQDAIDKKRMTKIDRLMTNVSSLIVGSPGKPGMKDIVASVFTIASATFKDMTKKEIDLVVKKVEGLGKLFDVALKFTQVLSAIDDIAPHLGAVDTAGGEGSQKLEAILTAVITTMEGSGGKTGLVYLVGVMKKAAEKMPSAKGFGRKIENLNLLMKGIPDIVNAMAPISAMVSAGTVLTAEKAQGMGLVFQAIWNVVEGTEGGMGVKLFAKKMQTFGGKDLDVASTNIAASTGSMGAMFTNLNAMIDAMVGGGLVEKLPSITTLQTKMTEVFAGLGALLFGGDVKDYKVGGSAKWVPGPGSVIHFAEKIARGMQAVLGGGATLSTTVGNISGFVKAVGTMLSNLGGEGLQKQFKDVAKMGDEDMAEHIKTSMDLITGYYKNKTHMSIMEAAVYIETGNWSENLSPAAATIRLVSIFATTLADEAQCLSKSLPRLATVIAGGWTGTAVSNLATIAHVFDAMIDLHNVIAGNKNVTLSGMMDEVGEFVELKNKKIVVEASDKIVIQLNAHFKIDADAIAVAIGAGSDSEIKVKRKNRLARAGGE
jgi:hypothetical protein